MWSKPLVDMDRYALENSRLKPVFPAMLEGLWSFHKEGRLGMKLGKRADKNGNEKSVMRFYLKD